MSSEGLFRQHGTRNARREELIPLTQCINQKENAEGEADRKHQEETPPIHARKPKGPGFSILPRSDCQDEEQYTDQRQPQSDSNLIYNGVYRLLNSTNHFRNIGNIVTAIERALKHLI